MSSVLVFHFLCFCIDRVIEEIHISLPYSNFGQPVKTTPKIVTPTDQKIPHRNEFDGTFAISCTLKWLMWFQLDLHILFICWFFLVTFLYFLAVVEVYIYIFNTHGYCGFDLNSLEFFFHTCCIQICLGSMCRQFSSFIIKNMRR